jgi:DNA-binding IclR family transcriptional regulator
VSEIAGSPRINVSTAHRLLRTPTRRGYAEQNPDTRSYARGPRHLELGSAYAGHHEPAHCAAIGTVQLAFLPEQGFERFVERGPLVVPVSRPSGRANAAISIAMPKPASSRKTSPVGCGS